MSSCHTFRSVPTDKLFTGQRLDGAGLYYYNARYYDPTIGRFISADSIVPNPMNPQSLNRYSYFLNNPLKYIEKKVDKAYNDVASNLGSNQMVAWSSDKGYYAIDKDSISCYKQLSINIIVQA